MECWDNPHGYGELYLIGHWDYPHIPCLTPQANTLQSIGTILSLWSQISLDFITWLLLEPTLY